MKNKDVVAAFLRRERAALTKNGATKPLHSSGSTLYSYAAEIGHWINGKIVLTEPYRRSPTTSRHCNLLARALGYASFAKGLEEQNG